jgi:hypothetical protein
LLGSARPVSRASGTKSPFVQDHKLPNIDPSKKEIEGSLNQGYTSYTEGPEGYKDYTEQPETDEKEKPDKQNSP